MKIDVYSADTAGFFDPSAGVSAGHVVLVDQNDLSRASLMGSGLRVSGLLRG
ncbi:hypothetical protein [Planktotalea arctica]|uniref:hypothetical protein n=1 Tax=Planktotalea arctica TaxID=1481893 RepID=UPI0015938C89|nr:hypothetical protein [Planktotalea arctica]